ncbi:MAG: hypothetical protein JOZ04_05450, partial [Acidimicrobiia bacterium]|nr:hypothetical protein [Acidimicrobiia bacterium]
TGSQPDAAYGQIPGTTLTAHADASDAHAVADVQGAQQPGTATYGNMHSDSSSTLTGNSVKALADSVLHNVDIGNGAVKIKSLTSTATATTDGTTSSAAGGTVVQGMTVGGQPASIDQDGLHLGSSTQPLNAAASAAANQALAGLGMKVFVSQPQLERSNGTTTYTASSVVFSWFPPDNPSQNVVVLTLGGARVSVAAGAGFGQPTQAASDSGGPGVSAAATGAGADNSAVSGPAGVSGDTGPSGGAGAVASPTGNVGGGQGGQGLAGQTIAKTFEGVGAVWLLIGLAAAGLLGYGLHRLLVDLVDRPPVTCPLEVRR